MKKLFVFASSLVMASMIHSASTESVIVFTELISRNDYGYDSPKTGPSFNLTVNPDTDTVQVLIDGINTKFSSKGYSVDKLYF